VSELIEEYRQDLTLLVPDRISAQETPADVEIPAVDQAEIVLVPLQSRPYYPQALLYPQWSFPRLQ
jgi:hypothetical protein